MPGSAGTTASTGARSPPPGITTKADTATQQSELTALAVEWTILTAARYNEVHGCTDAEIDWERRLWTIPARGMKASREHVVPLSDRLRPVYDIAMWRTPAATDRLFPVSDTAMRRLCRQISGKPITPHGFYEYCEWNHAC
jgi:integrase